ncbi:MAG TPA: hypothetical protein P5544_10315 [Candidatus Nanopelagicales bacterium]|nr:hypothetical protein [Candidatus Nanopelagicales bacterium]
MFEATEAAIISARARVEADPTLFDSLALVGTVELSKSGKRLFGLGRTDGQAIDEGFRGAVAAQELEPDARIGFGVVLIGQDAISDLQSRLAAILADPQLTALHPLGRGISYAAPAEPTSDVASVEMLGSTPRLDSSIVSASELIRASYLADESMLIAGPVLSQLVPGVRYLAARESPVSVDSAPVADGTIAVTLAQASAPPTPDAPAVGALTPPPAPLPPLRQTYFVIDTSRAAKQRAKRTRLTQLVREMDQGLVPSTPSTRSDSIVVASSEPVRASVPKVTGTLLDSDVWGPSDSTLDLSVTMPRLREIMVRHRESKTRRNELLAKPLVLFILPTAALFGATTIGPYREIKTLADIGWVVTDPEGPPPSIEIDPDRLVFDHPDAVNEILYRLGYPQGVSTPALQEDCGTEQPQKEITHE